MAAVDHAGVLLQQVTVESGELMDSFPRDGPLGQKEESLSLLKLRTRSRAASEQSHGMLLVVAQLKFTG